MACIPLPSVTPPTLPHPLSLDPPPLPPITVGAEFCCKLPVVNVVPPPVTLGPLDPAVIATINATMATVRTYLDAQVLECPRE